ncbi:MAG TPA: hypothetical protein VKB34_20465 [Povalibacter sp.]|nr:hypothetical protein [Povalibacter sp.]
MNPWSIYLVLALGPSECFIVLRPKADDSDVGTEALLVRWRENEGFSASYIDRGIVAAAVLPASRKVISCTALGRVFALDDQASQQARIDTSENGPGRHGFIMGMRAVQRSIFAFGMGRQVYRLDAGDAWTRADQGLLDTSTSVDVTTGTLALDGQDADNLLAAGFNGELWRYRSGAWNSLDSPTNLSLHSVCALSTDEYVVCGQAGTFLHLTGDAIGVVPQPDLTGDLQQVGSFRDSLFLATDTGIFRCADRKALDAWQPACAEADQYVGFSSDASSIWLYGSDRIVCSADANTWKRLDLQPLWTLIS